MYTHFSLSVCHLWHYILQIELLDYRQKRLLMEPVNINNLLPLENKLDDLEFRRVICKGVFDEKKSIYVGPRSRSISGVTENGHYVITPLMPIPGLPDRYFPVKLYGWLYQFTISILWERTCITYFPMIMNQDFNIINIKQSNNIRNVNIWFRTWLHTTTILPLLHSLTISLF